MSRDATITIRGYVGKDATIMKAKSGVNYAQFTVAVPDWRKEQGGDRLISVGTDWYTVKAFKSVYAVYNTVRKGTSVLVTGRFILDTPYINKLGEPVANKIVFATDISIPVHDKKSKNNDDFSDFPLDNRKECDIMSSSAGEAASEIRFGVEAEARIETRAEARTRNEIENGVDDEGEIGV